MGFVLVVGYLFSFILGFALFVAVISLLTGCGKYNVRHSSNIHVIVPNNNTHQTPVVKTYEMYEQMIKEDISKLSLVPDEFMNKILEYVSNLSDSCIYATYLPQKYQEEFILNQLKKNGNLSNVPVSLRTCNVCREALLIDYEKNYKYVPDDSIITRGIAENAFYNNKIPLKMIPKKLITQKIAEKAFDIDDENINTENISFVPDEFVTNEMMEIFFENHRNDWYKYNIPKKYQNEDDINSFIACKMCEDDYDYLINIKINTSKLVKLINKNPLLIHKLNKSIVKDVWFEIEYEARDIVISKYTESKSLVLINELFKMSGNEFNEKYSNSVAVLYHTNGLNLPNGVANNVMFTCENLVITSVENNLISKNVYKPPIMSNLSCDISVKNNKNSYVHCHIRDVCIPQDATVKFYLPNIFVTDKAILGNKRFFVDDVLNVIEDNKNIGKQLVYYGRSVKL